MIHSDNDGLWVALGFKADTLKLKDFIHAIGELNMQSVASALGVGLLYEATQKIMTIADETAMGIFKVSQATGLSTKDIQQFSDVVEQLGGNVG